MRLNQFLAQNTSLSRRSADKEISLGNVKINNQTATLGDKISDTDKVSWNDLLITSHVRLKTILFNKPPGYVCSRIGQGNKTIYDILPTEYHSLNPVGRLDKDSSGLLMLTSDGELANRLTHPKYQKIKIYEVKLNKPLSPLHQQMISDFGISLEDGPSKLQLEKMSDAQHFSVKMAEGRNRQIRRTFGSLGYDVLELHRTVFGDYKLDDLRPGKTKEVS